MALETATYISGLVATNPLSSDPKSQGDDHLRLIKSTILATFPNITGAVTATHTELNYVTGVTSGIQSQLNSISALASGTKALHLITAATASATLANAANQINWNWTLTGASGKGLSVSETAASTAGAGAQDLVSIGTLAASTANPLRVTARGADAILVGRFGAVSVNAVGANSGGSNGNDLTLSAAAGVTSGNGGAVNITAGNAGTAGFGGDITLTPGSGFDGTGRVNFVNSNSAKATVACVFTANVGPTGANTAIQGWLTVKVGGTVRYIPYW